MNYRFVINQLGLLLIVLAVILLGVATWEFLEYLVRGQAGQAMALGATLTSAGIGFVIGGALWLTGRAHRRRHIARRDAMLLVASSWFAAALLGALPFYFWAVFSNAAAPEHPFHRFIDCYFESMSGLSTAGSSILSDIESLPRGLLLWRSLTHWLGGLGIVVLFVIVLPTVGVGSKRLVSAESPVHARSGMRPRILETARTLLAIYVGLTAAEVLALCCCGLSLFDAVNHAFATIATGGYSTRNASVGAYRSSAVDLIVTVFMIFGAINFGLYYLMINRRWSVVWRNTELRVFLALVAGGVLVVAISIYGTTIVTTTGDRVDVGVWEAFRYAAFNVVSLQTDTGFATADFDRWPDVAKFVIFTLTIIGGCVGSTSGGIKIIRLWVVVRVLINETERLFRPELVRPIRSGDSMLGEEAQRAVLTYALAFGVTLLIGAALIHLFEQQHPISMVTSLTASIATICDAGPGLDAVGPTQNFGWLSDPSKLVLTCLMILGRLEIFALLALLTPTFWRAPR